MWREPPAPAPGARRRGAMSGWTPHDRLDGPSHRRNIGRVFERDTLLPSMAVGVAPRGDAPSTRLSFGHEAAADPSRGEAVSLTFDPASAHVLA